MKLCKNNFVEFISNDIHDVKICSSIYYSMYNLI